MVTISSSTKEPEPRAHVVRSTGGLKQMCELLRAEDAHGFKSGSRT
jgi:hypothetical protein